MNRKDFEDVDEVLSGIDRAIKEAKELNEYQSKIEYRIYKDPDKKVPVVIKIHPNTPDYTDSNTVDGYDPDRFLFEGYETKDEAEKMLVKFLDTINKLKYWKMKDNE
ncbi:MAG: hypothetical protein K9L56_15260 [Clostridiales bacterium]|nr:hypothetical protein [Clostridiales bacterium]